MFFIFTFNKLQILEQEILKNIDQQQSPLSITDIRRFFKLTIGYVQQREIDQRLTTEILSFLDDNPFVRTTKNGECDILITHNKNSFGGKLIINSNLYDCDDNCSEEYVIQNDIIPFDKLDQVIKRNYCFNLFNALHVIRSVYEKGEIDLYVAGKNEGLFVVGEELKFCMHPDFESHCILLDVNIEGVFKLFPIYKDQRDQVRKGETQCSIDIKVSPPIGNEMIVAIGVGQEDLISDYSQQFNEDNPIVLWKFDNLSTNNAINLSETVFLNLINEHKENWSVNKKFIRILDNG